MTSNTKAKTVYWIENKLYLNITNKCSNCCFFCIKRYKPGIGNFPLKFLEEPNFDQIKEELSQILHMRNWSEVVFCGFGEPTERLDILLMVTRWLREHYGKPLRIRVNTNGHGDMLNHGRDVVSELKSAGIDKLSISLNAGDRETYKEICRPIFDNAFESVMRFVKQAKDILQVEVTVVRIPEVDIEKARAVAEELGVPFRVRDYSPCFY
jgi:TatD family-associated radical SAM protein